MSTMFDHVVESDEAPDRPGMPPVSPPGPTPEPPLDLGRMPEALQEAIGRVADMGPHDEGITEAANLAVRARLEDDIRRSALRDHFARFPEDVPDLADVAKLRVSDSDHPAAGHPDLVEEVAAWVERHHPTWATSGDVDATIEDVLAHAAQLAEEVGG